MTLARSALPADTSVGGGTRANFTELNRLRPAPGELDAATYAINPQVHAFDEASILETPATVALTVRDARTFLADCRCRP